MAQIPSWMQGHRDQWANTGRSRPDFARIPGPGQESVWDYPRPPQLVADAREVVVRLGEHTLAQTRRAQRVLETASPPTFYLPPEDVDVPCLVPSGRGSVCEWKGAAQYWSVRGADETANAIWTYPDPFPGFEPIAGWFAFYPARFACFVAGERVTPQPGGFYGGWVTSEIVGPMKGEPGTGHW